jgi:hypothetical protein
VLVTWAVLKFVPDRLMALYIGGVGNMVYLLSGYWLYATDNYDIDWTVAQVCSMNE